MDNKIVLRLYVMGRTVKSQQSIRNLQRICKDSLEGTTEITIIDVLKQPHLAEEERILATPTLIKAFPPPIRRIIGDLSDTERVLQGLDLEHRERTSTEVGQC